MLENTLTYKYLESSISAEETSRVTSHNNTKMDGHTITEHHFQQTQQTQDPKAQGVSVGGKVTYM